MHNVISPFAETTELLKWKQDKNNFEMRILLLGSVKCKNRDLIRYIKVALSKVLSVHMKYIYCDLWAYHIREPAGLMYGRSSHMYNIKAILSSIITILTTWNVPRNYYLDFNNVVEGFAKYADRDKQSPTRKLI